MKCDLCSKRRAEGMEPVCVTNCAGGAIMFGDVDDENSAVSLALKSAGQSCVCAKRSGCASFRAFYFAGRPLA